MMGVEDEVWQALDDYEEACDQAYYKEESEAPQDIQETSESSLEEQDFPEPLQLLAVSTSSQEAQVGSQEIQSTLEETTLAEMGAQDASSVSSNFISSTLPILPKLPSRKHLAKQLKLASSCSMNIKVGEELIPKRLMSQPPGTAFFGCKTTIIQGWIQSQEGPKQDVTFNSGSEITLINERLLKTLKPEPRIKTGQHLKLIQVTGPVKMLVKAYVVPKMNTPFILGTDFATQFQLSLQ
ncbi:hypothetical protein CTheo_8833 [Ceratobasidium theobromae]|uniref:Uncharacterized protein n=1 Tax=Ceratobasidium theobromae TaxID=1582974 RepID=A0A5N5Q8I6_9AGAM|nr:hypothetical protein CTheo_8833 [Ceratobasidium theobromae]